MSMKKINYYLLLGTLIAPWVIVAPNARSAPSVSLQQAINIALSENGGRVLSAQSKNGQGATRHHIRLLVDGGRVLNVVVDGRGRVQRTR